MYKDVLPMWSLFNNLCGSQVESDEARRHLYFHWSVNFYFDLGKALFAAAGM
jgi:hypothetical protein